MYDWLWIHFLPCCLQGREDGPPASEDEVIEHLEKLLRSGAFGNRHHFTQHRTSPNDNLSHELASSSSSSRMLAPVPAHQPEQVPSSGSSSLLERLLARQQQMLHAEQHAPEDNGNGDATGHGLMDGKHAIPVLKAVAAVEKLNSNKQVTFQINIPFDQS